MSRDRLDLETYYQSLGIFGKELEERVTEGLRRIDEGYPIAYLVKEAYFYDIVLTVDESVLIPRPDTERLCEKALKLLPKAAKIADLGTGSGAIAVTVLYHLPDASGIAVDLSRDALKIARHNAIRYGVDGRLRLLEGDMCEGVLGEETFDLILSNPPYIPTKDILKYPSLAYEPQMALDGGEDGMDFYRTILAVYRKNLKAGGGFLFEIGFDQKEAIRALAQELGYTCAVYKDYGKNDRVALLYPTADEKG